jgi:hypothetical protein
MPTHPVSEMISLNLEDLNLRRASCAAPTGQGAMIPLYHGFQGLSDYCAPFAPSSLPH